MDITGTTVGRVSLKEGTSICDLAWNCERFNMEEQIEENSGGKRPDGKIMFIYDCDGGTKQILSFLFLLLQGTPHILSVCFKNGEIMLMRSYDDCDPLVRLNPIAFSIGILNP